MKKNISVYIDITFCVIVLPAMAVIFPIERWFHNFRWYVLTVGIWLYLLYFINRAITVPSLFGNGRRRLLGLAMLLISLAVTGLLAAVTLYPPRASDLDTGIARLFPYIQQYQQAVWSLFMIVEAFSFAVGMLTQSNLNRARARDAEAERTRAEIELYKAQIKPHFMFNTLNSLYGLFLTRSDIALASLEKFISMMRYIHSSSSTPLLPLADEVDYISRYIDLQSLRLNGKTRVKTHFDVSNPALRVPPMLLVTFVENCFKHGASPVEESEIEITLTELNGLLRFNTSNRIFPVERIGEHMGIENCRKRLQLLYPNAHSLQITANETTFRTSLTIDLTKWTN